MRVLMPLPSGGFDPTESAIPWQTLTAAGHQLLFATPDGRPASADERMLSGRGLGPWRGLLRAREDAVSAYRQMAHDPAFVSPHRHAEVGELVFDALLLPGGHAPPMRTLLEAKPIQQVVARHMQQRRPIAAICHGTIVMARSQDAHTGRSVLYGRRTTMLLKSQELSAWLMTRLWLGNYYRTYPETVQDEVRRAVGAGGEVLSGPPPLFRDAPDRLERGFVVHDDNYLSARWPGDAYAFAAAFAALLQR